MLGIYYAGQPYPGQSGLALNIDLVVADSLHSHLADSPSLTQANILVVAPGLHGHLADVLSLTQQNVLTVSPALHAHIADNISTVLTYTLDVQAALHAHYGDNVTIVVPGLIAPDTGTHGHFAENVALIQQHILQVQDAIHAQTASNVPISVHLVVDNAYHQMVADEVSILINARDGSPRVSVVRQAPRTAIIGNDSRLSIKSPIAGPRTAQMQKDRILVSVNEQKSRVKKFR